MGNNVFSIVTVSILFMLPSIPVLANELEKSEKKEATKPLWEIGVGLGAFYQPFYIGTKQTRNIIFPVIKPTYRGKVFKFDDEGARAQLFKNDRIKLDFSADLNLSVDSDDVDLREGLDDVENVLQLGPSFEYLLKGNSDRRLSLTLPIRGVFEVGSDFETSGFNISPSLFYEHDFNMFNNRWKLDATLGAQFGSAAFHDIYYGVDSQFATANRDAYEAESGYSGTRLELILDTENRKRSILWFLRYDNINGATFDDSPLVETNNSLTLGFLYSYKFFKSNTLVKP